MSVRIGSGYIGSPNLETTSSANFEIIPNPPTSFHYKKYNLYKLSFLNHNLDCRVIINGGNPIFLAAGQGFEMNEIDTPIYSFKIVETGISYNWLGAYS